MKTRYLIMGLVSCFIIAMVLLVYINKSVYESLEEVRSAYRIPDTTITYSGGKYDTIIVQKSVPSWLK